MYKFEVQRKRQKSLVIHRLIILPQARPPINEVKVQIRSIRDMNRPKGQLISKANSEVFI